MPPIDPSALASWLRIGMDVASFLARAIPKLVELFHHHGSDEEKALDALDLGLEAARKANDIRLAAKHHPIAVPSPREFDEPIGEDDDDAG